ncbi:dockerin type I domain-containing protein [Stieleria sp. JC731]|uniref:dockerin type I domain-containing protein n=1 Tax=Pirellulaceae TaxID=2691357 RepID=UPI001E53D0EA|nr:dockerin type I domain-containing protein [Stieleria sp. JC731]MCC9603064.1 dockerin type I domain-containing protein [Stieleria sp. JC731]
MPQSSRQTKQSVRFARKTSRRSRPNKRRRRLFAESLERRQLLAADPYVFDIPDDPSLEPGEINQTMISVSDNGLIVFDINQQVVLDFEPLFDVSSIQINGGDDNNELILDFSGGDFTVPVGFEGGNQSSAVGDQLTLINGSADSIGMGFNDAHSGSIELVTQTLGINQTITYTGLEPVVVSLTATTITFDFLGGDETITLGDDAIVNDGMNQIDSTLGELVSFASPSDSVIVNSGLGIDQVFVTELDAASTFSDLTINGDEGDDVITIENVLSTIAATVNGGDGVDTITIGSAAGTLDGILGTVSVNGGVQPDIGSINDTVTAKGAMASSVVIGGDELIIDDSGSPLAHDYEVTATSVQRIGNPAISYDMIEQLTLRTGIDADSVDVLSTGLILTTVESGDGDDAITVTSTADGSALRIDTGNGNDVVSVTGTGTGQSVTTVNTGLGDDDIQIDGTGIASGLSVDASDGVDVISIAAVGTDSINSLGLGGGADVINVRSLAAGSLTEVFGDDGNDTFNLSSLADGDRLNPEGSMNGDLDGLIGEICLFGDAHLVPPEITDSLTVGGSMVSVAVPRGDQVNISDRASVADNAYTFEPTQFTRVGGPTIELARVESVQVETGSGNDTLQIASVQAVTFSSFVTGAGDDTVQLAATGSQSLVSIQTQLGNDTVTIDSTGSGSLVNVATGDDQDVVDVVTTGASSGLSIDTGIASDVITIVGVGNLAVTSVSSGDQNDVINVRSSAIGSETELDTGDGNDTINLSSDADGNLLNPSGDPAGDLDGFLGALTIDGGGEEPAVTRTDAVTVKSSVMVDVEVPVGDTVNISDEDNAAGMAYVLGVNTFQRVVTPVFNYVDIESVNLETGDADDQVTLLGSPDSSTTNITTGDGLDIIVISSTGADSLTTVDAGQGNDLLVVNATGANSVTRASTGEGNDDVSVASTGAASGLAIDTAAGIDLFEVHTTGQASVLAVNLGTENDVANVIGTGIESTSEFFGGDGDDTFNVNDSADGTRLDPRGTQVGTLDQLGGLICVFGEGDTDPSSVTFDVAAHRTDSNIATVSETVVLGDQLNIADNDHSVNSFYELTSSTFVRTLMSAGMIVYGTVESVQIETGSGDDTFDVQSTADAVYTDINTGIGTDQITVQTTGVDSITEINSGADADQVTVDSTGSSSILGVMTEIGSDAVSISSLGDLAGVMVSTGDQADSVTLNPEPLSPVRTGEALIAVQAGSGADTIDVNEVYLNTTVDLQGGGDNDLFTLTADGSDSAGYLGKLNDDPNADPSVDSIAATRQLFIDGGANDGTTVTFNEGAGTTGPTLLPIELTEPNIETGDRIRLVASSATTALDLRYAITGPAAGVLVSTVPGSPRQTVGNEVFETFGIEDIEVTTGAGNDVFTVSSDDPFDIGVSLQRVGMIGGPGTDKFEVLGTAGADQITIGTVGDMDAEPLEISGVEFIRVEGGDGDDQLVNRTSVISVMDGLGGNDIMFGGSGQDLLTGGSGVDFLYARGGNDILFTDQDLGSNAEETTDGEIIDGGSEAFIPLGDVCIQHGTDQIRNCEVVGDGGGEKDVITWLRAIFIDPNVISFSPLHPSLTPFAPAFPNPVAALAVTEPSKLPLAPSPGSTSPPSEEDPVILANSTDVNGDGTVSPTDALVVINLLSIGQSGESSLYETNPSADVNGNGTIEPRDALMVINYLSVAEALSSAESEGIGEGDTQSDSALSDAGSWLDTVDTAFAEDEEDWLDSEQGLF